MIYYSTIHALELICSDSNTQENMKKHLYPSDFSNFLPMQWRIPHLFHTTVTQMFTCISYIYYVQKWHYTV